MEAARGEFNQRHEQFQALVRPLTEDYRNLNPQITQLIQQNSSLAQEAGRLADALSNNREVGNWGEIQLRRVVELAGMTPYCDFAEQRTLDSRERPDMVVRLPERRTIIVDAKASAAAYLEARQQEDPEKSSEIMSRHAKAMKAQVDELAQKEYRSKDRESLDFVVMFVPGDQFLAAALREEPGLVEYGMGKKVAIATPASLISLLWAVSQGWCQHNVARDARAIQQAGEEMHKRLMGFINHYERVGRGLESAVKSYNTSVNSFDRMVAPQGRKFASLAVADEDTFPELPALEETPRTSRYAGEDGDVHQAADN